MRRGPLVAAGMLLLTFTVGALAGMAAEEAFGLDWFDFFEEARRRDAEGDRLLAGLSLTVAQQARAEEILERQEDRLEDYWEARLPEIGGLTEQSQGEIRALLTPTQQAVFDHRVRELDGRVPTELRED